MTPNMLPPPSPSETAVAFFGSSETPSDSFDYETAREAACRLSQRGFSIVTGGYGGIMEAANRGTREGGGGRSLGITTRSFDRFPERRVNAWLDEEIRKATLIERTEELFRRASAFVVFPGRAGTLAEAALLWAHRRAEVLGEKAIVLVGEVWENTLSALLRDGWLSERETKACRLARSADDVVESIVRHARS